MLSASGPRPKSPAPKSPAPSRDPVAVARKTLLEGVGAEIAASFPGITRLGGQIVAALYLSDVPRSMDELSAELGRSKSNIFANLRGLEAAGIVAAAPRGGRALRHILASREVPRRHHRRLPRRLRRVVADKQALCQRTLEILGTAKGPEADAIRDRMHTLARKYDKFAILFSELLPALDGPLDLEAWSKRSQPRFSRRLPGSPAARWAS